MLFLEIWTTLHFEEEDDGNNDVEGNCKRNRLQMSPLYRDTEKHKCSNYMVAAKYLEDYVLEVHGLFAAELSKIQFCKHIIRWWLFVAELFKRVF